MATAIRRSLAAVREQGEEARRRAELPVRASAGHALWWRWMPWTAPRLRLAHGLCPRTRLDLALTALYRCQHDWPVGALVERLALAPAGSDDNMALVTATHSRAAQKLGRGAAWDAVRDWLERGVLVEVDARAGGPIEAKVPAGAHPASSSEHSALSARTRPG